MARVIRVSAVYYMYGASAADGIALYKHTSMLLDLDLPNSSKGLQNPDVGNGVIDGPVLVEAGRILRTAEGAGVCTGDQDGVRACLTVQVSSDLLLTLLTEVTANRTISCIEAWSNLTSSQYVNISPTAQVARLSKLLLAGMVRRGLSARKDEPCRDGKPCSASIPIVAALCIEPRLPC